MNCKNPVRLKTGLLVPCGKCLACRIHKRKEWTMRCMHELFAANGEAIFVTLTYSDDNLPHNQSLCKSHLQSFISRLRKDLDRAGKPKIRYIACGEYGDKTDRPHYHAIIFDLPFNNESKMFIIQNWPYCDWTVPAIMQNSFGNAEADSIRYVCQYIDKKYTGDLALKEYRDKNREPVFKLSSQGIGKRYIDKYYQEIKDNLKLTLNGVNHSLPRYYINRLDLDISSLKDELEIKEAKRYKRKTGVNKITQASDRDESIAYYTQLAEYNKSERKSRHQHDKNLNAKLSLKRKKL